VKAILAAGGIPVWAHPLGGEGERRISAEEFQTQLETLLSYGLQGLECWYSRYTEKEIQGLLGTAQEKGLLVSGGSDYHGANKPHLALGSGTGQLCVPAAWLEPLRSLATSTKMRP